MQSVLGALTLVLLIGLVIARSAMLRRKGIKAVYFGNKDKKDFLLPPFALVYFYTVFAGAFSLPMVATVQLFESAAVAWIGVLFCLASVLMFVWSLISFGTSFRVGIDTERPDTLVTTGAFAISRNPIYVAFIAVLVGEFLIQSNLILLVYAAAAIWLINRQVMREEAFLRDHYGSAYAEYTSRVRRYL